MALEGIAAKPDICGVTAMRGLRWRLAENFEAVINKGLPFLRNKAERYRLI